ncbi:MAG: PAS domain S-box protein [Desulfatibacillaceae bacterium]
MGINNANRDNSHQEGPSRESVPEGRERPARKTDARFRAVFEQAMDSIFIHDDQGRIVDVNKKACKSLGYSREELLGLSVRDIDPHAEDRGDMEVLWGALARHFQATFEAVHRKKDGSLVPVEVSLGPVQEGDTRLVLAIARDISRRKADEEALRKSEERFDLAMKGVRDCLLDWYDIGTDRAWVSPGLWELLECSEKGPETSTSELLTYVLPEDRSAVKNATRKHLTSCEPYDVQFRARTATGRIKWFRARATAIRNEDGRAVRMCGTLQDIDMERRMVEAIRESEAKFRGIAERSFDMIFIADPEARFTYVSPAAERIFGLEPAQIREASLFRFVRKQDMESVKRYMTDVALGRKPGVLDFVIERGDGNESHVEISATTVIRDGELAGIQGILRDITDRKRLEKQLAQARKLEAIGTLAGGIAHNFNNVLGAILGYTELAQMIAEDHEDHEEIREYLNGAIRACRRARDIIRQIMIFSPQDEGARAPMLADALIKQSVKFFNSTLPDNIQAEYHVSRAPMILSNPSEINQILMSLCSNARTAMAESGGTLRVEYSEGSVEPDSEAACRGLRPGPCAVLTVEDTGRGMEPDVMERIFDPYFTTNDPARCSGLGLSTALSLAACSGACILVESRPGEGSKFSVVFEAVTEKGNEAGAAPGTDEVRENPGTVLLVDDEKDLLMAASLYLERHGFPTQPHTDPATALAAFRKEPLRYDLVLTDLIMPGMSGYQLIERAREIRPGVAAVIWTGYSDSVDETRLAALGVDARLLKPTEGAELLNSVRKALKSKGKPAQDA